MVLIFKESDVVYSVVNLNKKVILGTVGVIVHALDLEITLDEIEFVDAKMNH